MNAFDYSGPSQIAKKLESSRKSSVKATKSVEIARDRGVDLGTIYGISKNGDESVRRYQMMKNREINHAPKED